MPKIIHISFPKDKSLGRLNAKEEKRQTDTLNLIASENFMSPAVRMALASVVANKYAEGYPGARYYPGCAEAVDPIELLAQERALKLMKLNPKKWGVNVQALSGVPANLAVLHAFLKPGDKAVGMKLSAGGHLSHGHSASVTGKIFEFHQYGLDKRGYIDYEEVERLAKKYEPKIIICGASAYARVIDFKRFGAIARRHKALLMADVAHIAGLIAAGAHPSPFPYADIVTTTTHKTLRGPRGALIYARGNLMPAINKSVFPGLQGGPHNNQTLAIAVALGEALRPAFKTYARQIVKNAKVLAQELQKYGFKVVSGGTDNHLLLLDLRESPISGGDAEKILYGAGIVANRNTVPEDPRKPFDPSGVRLGTPSLTTRGFKEKEMKMVASWIYRALTAPDKKTVSAVRHEVQKLARMFPPKF